jgi:hypothetical protein
MMMRVSIRSILTGAAAVLAIGAVTPAMAGDGQVHVMLVRLPGGGVEQIRYTGDVAPRVVLVPSAAPVMVPVMMAPVMMADPFADLERVSAMMDQQAMAMMRQAAALARAPAGMLPGLPPGASGYSFASTMSGNGVCTRSIRITYPGGDAAPRMVSSAAGDCGSGHGSGAPTGVTVPAPAVRSVPNTTEARATVPTADAGPVQQVALNR